VKDADSYLPSDQEVMTMITQAQEAAKNREPSPEDKKSNQPDKFCEKIFSMG
jgi:hypothetical protein